MLSKLITMNKDDDDVFPNSYFSCLVTTTNSIGMGTLWQPDKKEVRVSVHMLRKIISTITYYFTGTSPRLNRL